MKYFKEILLIVLSIILALIFLELILEVVKPQPKNSSWRVQDEETGTYLNIKNSNAKHQYLRATISNQQAQQQIALGKTTSPIAHTIQSSQRRVPTSAHTNYIAPIASSMHLNTLKANAVGKTAYKVNLPNSAPIASKSYYPSGTKSAIRRVRSGGCVAPKKKGSIENRSLTNGGSGAGWGSIPRQNY